LGFEVQQHPLKKSKRLRPKDLVSFLRGVSQGPKPTLSGGFVAAAMARAAASGLVQSDGRFLGPATFGVIV
jgi:hypothetical protein